MKCLIIYNDDFPYSGARPEQEALEALKILGEMASPGQAAEKLRSNTYDTVVNLHGGYVLKEGWRELLAHLKRGGGLVNCGASAFRHPVRRINGEMIIEREQTAYHRDLGISNIFEVKRDYARFEVNGDFDFGENVLPLFGDSPVSEFSVRFTHSMDKPLEHGSSGPMEATIRSLVFALSEDGRKAAAPVVLIENFRNEFAGGRWIFLNQDTRPGFWDKGGAGFLEKLANMASKPAAEIILRPAYASYYPGEQPAFLLQHQQAGGNAESRIAFDIQVSKNGRELFRKQFSENISRSIAYRTLPVDFRAEEGYYSIEMLTDIDGERRWHHSGFWGYDQKLLESGSRVKAEGDWFTKDGRVFPVMGMTYMAGDVHRKFLFVPNPAVWMDDFAFMRDSGINLIRTGTWTSFRNVMYVDGIAYEEVMRAIDAFILTAKTFDIEVVFNFFAFTPEQWEGVNPYLDPVSVEAQKRYVSAIVSRHARSANVSWDLINEPSACNPRKVFRGPQPNRDRYELAAWKEWLRERYHTIGELQEKWNLSSSEAVCFDDIQLPEDVDLAVVEERNEVPYPPVGRIRSLMAADYGFFTNHVFDQWAREMAEAIRRIVPGQLVAVGQDHATSGRRPHPFFHGRYMDYTTVHTWWQLDDIYWDSAFVKIPGKPALAQETGTMYVEDNDEKNRRSEEDVRDILERKLAYAFAANTAGAIPWVLNTNLYMDDENEVHIGMLRPDLTEKPEYEVVRGVYSFIGRNAEKLGAPMREDVAVVFSFSNSYSNRTWANIATRKCARVLTFNMKKGFLGFGDYDLDKIGNPKLIIFPSPRAIPDETWEALMKKAEEGSTVLITGPVNYDGHWALADRSHDTGLHARLKSVSREETVILEGKSLRAVFDGQLIGWVDKEITGDTEATLYTVEKGRGKLLWCPLPVEMNREDDAVVELYKAACTEAGIRDELEFASDCMHGVFVKKLGTDIGSVYIVISEDGRDRRVEFTDRSNGAHLNFLLPAGRSIMVAADASGRLTDSYGLSDISEEI